MGPCRQLDAGSLFVMQQKEREGRGGNFGVEVETFRPASHLYQQVRVGWRRYGRMSEESYFQTSSVVARKTDEAGER